MVAEEVLTALGLAHRAGVKRSREQTNKAADGGAQVRPALDAGPAEASRSPIMVADGRGTRWSNTGLTSSTRPTSRRPAVLIALFVTTRLCCTHRAPQNDSTHEMFGVPRDQIRRPGPVDR